jgi:hypothetical protein
VRASSGLTKLPLAVVGAIASVTSLLGGHLQTRSVRGVGQAAVGDPRASPYRWGRSGVRYRPGAHGPGGSMRAEA